MTTVRGEGYEVDPAGLRAGALEIRAGGSPLNTVQASSSAQINAAVAMNLGYETSRVLTQFGQSVRDAAGRAQERLTEHVEALNACADNYEDADQRNEEDFLSFLS